MARLIDWLRSVEFDDIVNSVIKQDSDAEYSLMNYKMAFDRLTRMTPGEDDGVKIYISEDLCICDGKKYVNMNDAVYAEWPVQLARCVEVSSDTSASREDIVGGMLYELTYDGFTPEEQYEYITKLSDPYRFVLPSNPYIVPLKRMEQKHHDNNCKYREDIGKSVYSWKDKGDLFWSPRRNGPKRHRERRQSLRCAQLEKLVEHWEIWRRFVTKYNALDLHWNNLKEADKIDLETLELVCDKGEEEAYLSSLLSYGDFSYMKAKNTHTVIGIRYAPNLDVDSVKALILSRIGDISPQFYFNVDHEKEYVNIDTLTIISLKTNKI